MGSSPRVRGKGERMQRRIEENGIIPAGAGKSLRDFSRRQPMQDHPRGCGEKLVMWRRWPCTIGSSPRVRGKDVVRAMLEGRPRIIPAGAGKRTPCAGRSWRIWDHPRGCGEKTWPDSRPCLCAGSSPRVRGKESAQYRRLCLAGIIPAGAGKRAPRLAVSVIMSDHPRGCGEMVPTSPRRLPRPGSSPRVRGKGLTPAPDGASIRIIPAGAGKRLRACPDRD